MPTVELNGIETFYHDYGNGKPLVVLHGANANHQVWAEKLQPVTDEYRILTYDLRGHGKTGPTNLDHYTIDTYVDDLSAFIDGLDLNDPAVLGHSWGGMIGYAFAADHPEKLSSLITVGASSPKIFSKREWLLKKTLMPVIMRLMQYERLMDAIEWGMTKLAGEESMVDTDELQRMRDAHDCDVPELERDEAIKINRATQGYFESSHSFELSGTPVLMLYGENEPMIEPHAEYLESTLEDCRSIEIPDASHNAQVDNPEFVRSRIREFLDDQFAEDERPATNG